jgi:hypothetical protein
MVVEGKGGGGDVLWAVLGVGINGLCSFLMGLEGRDPLMPSSSIPSPISLAVSIQASAYSPALIQQTLSLRRGNKGGRTALHMALRSVQM